MEKYSKEFLFQLYTMMLKIRLCEESLVQPIMDGQIRCPCHHQQIGKLQVEVEWLKKTVGYRT